ncbi:hypothetical protein E4U11_005469 [Claviceps purpurea]|nr:hypothetical protein E4U11_005469 [Claviceps purpurea]
MHAQRVRVSRAQGPGSVLNPREEEANEADILLIQRRRRPRARVTITPGTQQSTIPKCRRRRLDQLLPQRSHPTPFENGLRLFSVSQSADSLGRAIEIYVKDVGEETTLW